MKKNFYPNNKKKSAKLIVNILTNTYSFIGCLGGAILGFISLGFPGLAIGLIGGFVLGIAVKKAIPKNI